MCECKELIVKCICNKESIWNPSNCECECDKPYDIREYLNYENSKCKNKLVDKLVAECTENIDEVKIAEITSTELHSAGHENVCLCSYTVFVILAVIALAISIGIGTDFRLFSLVLKKILLLLSLALVLKGQTTI